MHGSCSGVHHIYPSYLISMRVLERSWHARENYVSSPECLGFYTYSSQWPRKLVRYDGQNVRNLPGNVDVHQWLRNDFFSYGKVCSLRPTCTLSASPCQSFDVCDWCWCIWWSCSTSSCLCGHTFEDVYDAEATFDDATWLFQRPSVHARCALCPTRMVHITFAIRHSGGLVFTSSVELHVNLRWTLFSFDCKGWFSFGRIRMLPMPIRQPS